LSLIALTNICRAYQKKTYSVLALHNVGITIQQGEFVAVMGPSGCGKTTLLNIVGMLDRVTRGTIEFNGVKVSDLSDNQRSFFRSSAIGIIFQSFYLIEELTALENVALPFLYTTRKAVNARAQALSALDRVGLAERSTHMPSQLSGGEMQRVAIARAIVMQPDVILADEPTGNLDTVSGQSVMDIIQGLNQGGTTIVLVTHDIKLANMAQRVIRLNNGRVVAS